MVERANDNRRVSAEYDPHFMSGFVQVVGRFIFLALKAAIRFQGHYITEAICAFPMLGMGDKNDESLRLVALALVIGSCAGGRRPCGPMWFWAHRAIRPLQLDDTSDDPMFRCREPVGSESCAPARVWPNWCVAPEASGATGFIHSEASESAAQGRQGRQGMGLPERGVVFRSAGRNRCGVSSRVAEVILNRVDDPRYPGSVCGVVNQGTGAKFRCQFTYTCDGRPETMQDGKAKEMVGKVAHLILDGTVPRQLTKGATHYHTKAVKPRWSKVFPRTVTIGYHHFYREPNRLAAR